MAEEIGKILDQDGISPETLAHMAGVHVSSIYRIINGKNPTAQRGTIKSIAEATQRNFKITGDRVEFFRKEAPEPAVDQTDPRMKRIISLLDKATDEELNEIGDPETPEEVAAMLQLFELIKVPRIFMLPEDELERVYRAGEIVVNGQAIKKAAG